MLKGQGSFAFPEWWYSQAQEWAMCHLPALASVVYSSSMEVETVNVQRLWLRAFINYIPRRRRKFRSQRSDNIDWWKSRGEKSQRGEEKRRREEQRRERAGRNKKEDAGAPKSRKVAIHRVFPMLCGPGAEPSGEIWDEELQAFVAQSRFPIQNVQNTTGSEHFWKLRCWKSARRCGPKHMSTSKCWKSARRCGAKMCEAHFQVEMLKADHFWTLRCHSVWRAHGIVHLVKVSKTWGFCSSFKNDGRRGTCEEDPQRCMSSGRRSTRDIFIMRTGCILRIRSSGLLSWFCVTGAALRMTWPHFFVAGAGESQNAVAHNGTRPSALHSTFHFWRKACRIASLLMLSTSKIEKVS